MRFSVFLNARTMRAEDDRKLIKDLESHAMKARDCGFEAIFMPDHHFNGYMPIASDSFIFAAYLAAQMPEMYFGFSVVSVPLHHPVRFVERINILDQLTDGKILVGVGSGTTPEEMIGFGVNYAESKDVEFAVTDTVTLVGGLRYTIDRRDGVFGNYGFRFNAGPVAPEGPPQSILTLEQDNEQLTWLAGVNYQPNMDTLVYGKVSTGYKSGGFDSVGAYDPETNTAYEGGVKLNLGPRGEHVLNGAGFYYDYKDLQTAVLLNPAIGQQVFNAGAATIWGFEVEGNFKLSPRDTFSASFNYLDAEYDELFASYAIFDTVNPDNNGLADLDPGPDVVQPNLAGNTLPQSPKYTITLGYDHVFDLGNAGTITASAYSRFKSEYFTTIFNYRSSEQEAYTQTDLSLKYQPASEVWSIQAFVRNLEDEQPLAYANFVSAGPDDNFDFAFQAPRTYGVRVGVEF